MNLLPAAAVFLLFTAGGHLRSRELRRRSQLLSELSQMTTEFSVAIRCTSPTLDELAEGCGGVFGELLRDSQSSTSDIKAAWMSAVQQLSRCSFCSSAEAAILTELGRGLGTCSAEGQLSLLELHGARLGKLRAEADAAAESKGRLYRSVGSLLGAGAAILII